jgi:hypothetical protein
MWKLTLGQEKAAPAVVGVVLVVGNGRAGNDSGGGGGHCGCQRRHKGSRGRTQGLCIARQFMSIRVLEHPEIPKYKWQEAAEKIALDSGHPSRYQCHDSNERLRKPEDASAVMQTAMKVV